MTLTELQEKTQKASPHFFDTDTLKFFGDRLSNYGVCDGGLIETWTDKGVGCWELYRKQPVKHNLQTSAFFCKETFRRVHPKL